LFVHDARVETVDSSGMTRSTAVSEFLHGPGSTSLHDDEVVAAVRLTPSSPGTGSAYRRFTERNALDLAFAGVAASVALEADGVTIRSVRLALGAVGPTVMDASEVTATLIGRTADTELLASVAEAAAGACSPITDHRCSADYRRQLVHVLTLEVIDEAMRRAGRDDNSDPRVQQGKQR
jgi:carbon-monoxide dehydrogenase medium subunit